MTAAYAPQPGRQEHIPESLNGMSTAEAFHFYRNELAWHVYPVDGPWKTASDYPGKKPLPTAWWTRDPKHWDLKRFFNANGECYNIGVAPTEGLRFIDLDDKKGQGAAVRAWLAAHPELNAFPRHETRNGSHLVVRCLDLPPWKRDNGRPWYDALSSDVAPPVTAALYFSSHSNVVLPPSEHPSGGVYRWDVFGDIPEVSWEWLQEVFGFRQPAEAHEPRQRHRKKGRWFEKYAGDLCSLDLLKLMERLGIRNELLDADDRKHAVQCPWRAKHTGGDKETLSSASVVFLTNDKFPAFRCLHDHCKARGLEQVLDWAEAVEGGIVDRFCSRQRLWKEGQTSPDNRPRVAHSGRLDTDVHKELADIMGPKNVWFRYGARLVAIRKVQSGFLYSSHPEEKYTRSAYVDGIADLSPTDVANEIEKHVEPGTLIKDSDGRAMFVPRSFSLEFCQRLAVSEVFLDRLPELHKILTVPIPFLYEGRLACPCPGYDVRFKTFLPNDGPKAVLDIALEEAINLLTNELLGGFCFVNEQSKCHALARIITPFARSLFPAWTTRTPFWMFWANRPRAGKDYCAAITCLLLLGFAVEEQPIHPRNSEETGKRLIAANLIGTQVMHFSNCAGYISDPQLTQAVTNQYIGGRILGSSTHTLVHNHADYSASANVGATWSEDLMERSRAIELAFFQEHSNSRTFPKPDLHGWIIENRAKLISAIFALLRNWQEMGSPSGSTFSSFPDWARIVGGAMQAAGLDDPCLPYVGEYTATTRDLKTEAMAELFRVCFEALPKDEEGRSVWTQKDKIYDAVHAAAFPEEVKDNLGHKAEEQPDANEALQFFVLRHRP